MTILDAGRATLELAEPSTAGYIDRVEVGRPLPRSMQAGHLRVALEVDDVQTATRALAGAGAEIIAEPTPTPFKPTNARLNAPAGLQLPRFRMDRPGS